MADQAEKLRQLVKRPKGYTLVLTGPKGGIGRTTLLVNLATLLQREGHRVCLVDLDIVFPNVSLILGERPLYSLGDVWREKLPLEKGLHLTQQGFPILTPRGAELAKISEEEMAELLKFLFPLTEQFDVLLFDSPAALEGPVTVLWNFCQEVLLVVTPEPPALIGMYTLLRSLPTHPFLSLLVNRSQSLRQEKDISDILCRAAETMTELRIHPYGGVPEDPQVVEAYHQRQPVVNYAPRSGASRAMAKMAKQILKKTRESESVSLFRKIV